MKYKIFLCLAAIVFVGFGARFSSQAVNDYQDYKDLQTMESMKTGTYEQLQQQLSGYNESLRASSIVLPESNVDIIREVGALKGLHLLTVTAQDYDSVNAIYTDVVTIENSEDAQYFTNTIDKMLFVLQVDDMETALSAIANSPVVYDYLSFSADNATLILRTDAKFNSEGGDTNTVLDPTNTEMVTSTQADVNP